VGGRHAGRSRRAAHRLLLALYQRGSGTSGAYSSLFALLNLALSPCFSLLFSRILFFSPRHIRCSMSHVEGFFPSPQGGVSTQSHVLSMAVHGHGINYPIVPSFYVLYATQPRPLDRGRWMRRLGLLRRCPLRRLRTGRGIVLLPLRPIVIAMAFAMLCFWQHLSPRSVCMTLLLSFPFGVLRKMRAPSLLTCNCQACT
jgi:hypothetical protein